MQLTVSNNRRVNQISFNNKLTDSIGKWVKTIEGETLKIKILDYLGDGKLVVDLKGQRIVANSNLMIEIGQEIDVTVKSTNNNQIVLQVLSEDQDRGGLQVESDGQLSKTEFLKQYDNKQTTYFELPISFDEQKADSLIGLNCQPNEKTTGISIAIDLKSLGYIVFLINIDDLDLNCQIISTRKDTYKLIKQNLSELKKCLSKLGYKVEGITCSLRRKNNTPVAYLDTSI